MSSSLRTFAFVLVALIWAACGGGAPATPAKAAKGGSEEKGAGEKGEEEQGGGEEEAAKASPCADGTCLECGNGLCPKGFFCDEKASGGPACAWLPECAASATCSCVKQALGASCTCSEKSGGVSVSCQGL